MVRTFHFRAREALKMESSTDYLEAQVWGPVTVSDVQLFIVNCHDQPDLFGKSQLVQPVTLEKLKRLNIPVHRCVEEKLDERLIRVKEGERL